ncbi:hypothetical protein E4U19_003116 [Claviceps sp. Clav32 group G5]|nr:hypothetical protein E4U19_003116 [Claviceps sp. Clav32 group G5]
MKKRPIHPKLKTLEKYVSRSWFDSDDRGINLKTATQTDLNDQVIYRLDWFLEDEISGSKLHRIVRGEFSQWNASVWKRVHPEVRKEFCRVLSERGIPVYNNDPSTEDSASKLAELPHADRTDVGSLLDKTSSDSNKKEEKLPEEPVSALPECVHFEEKQASVTSQQNPAADLDDRPCISPSRGQRFRCRQSQCRPRSEKIEGPQAWMSHEAALDKDSVVDRALVVLPDPPDLQKRRPSDGERPAKSPDDKSSPENSFHADPAVSKDLVAGVILNDPPESVDAVTDDPNSRTRRADQIFDGASEISLGQTLNKDSVVQSKASRNENPATFRDRDPAHTPTHPQEGTGPQEQAEKKEKILRGEFALAGHRSIPSTGMTWTDRAERTLGATVVWWKDWYLERSPNFYRGVMEDDGRGLER